VSLDTTELKIGKTTFKGAWIAVVFALASTIGGGVWTASSLYSRLEIVEKKSSNVKPLVAKVTLIEQRLEDNDVSQLKGKLATLGTRLETLLGQQKNLLELKDEVATLSKDIESIKGIVTAAEVLTKDLGDTQKQLKSINKEIDDVWEGMDYLSNPLK
jgi:DNA repair exonuclease SbcCD ATPase subunit